MTQQLAEEDERYFYFALQEFEYLVQRFGADLVLKNISSPVRIALLRELNKDKGV